ncbi:MAG: CRTAC1 family protein, partial [Gammaproteobacteria bacterium]|nr:CRTAC1 family protein [Gammaproteobacteria bacterium]
LPTAWRAARIADFGLCEPLGTVGLRETCLSRVADRKIETVLARGLAGTIEPNALLDEMALPAPGGGQAPTVSASLLPARQPGIEVRFFAHQERVGSSGRFRKLPAEALGISHRWTFSITDFFEPFIIGKGIASGDFNNDQWPDLVLATESGIRIYQNTGGKFALSPASQGELHSANVFLVTFVDHDGDGLQDVFATTYGGVNYVLRNVAGSFERASLLRLPGKHRLTLSAGFGDLDVNGGLDIVLGNWSSGLEKLFATDESGNVVMMRAGTGYEEKPLSGIAGETNSILISDVNADNYPDVLIGNDRLVPDLYYLGDGRGNLQPMANDAVPVTSMFTMSLDAADFNNDQVIDLFSTDMTFARSSRHDYCAPIADVTDKARCNELLDVYRQIQDGGAAGCNDLDSAADRQACFSVFSVRAAKSLQDPAFCDNLPERPAAIRSLCDYLARPAAATDPVDQNAYTPQVQRNTLLLGGDAGFSDRAEAFGVTSSFWSWNAKAADLDNDGWQDIYVGNGFHFGENFFEIQDNILFRNVDGQRFEEFQATWGLDDSVNTPSYTYLDLDLDGDLDILATGVIAQPRVYVNELDAGNSIAVSLNDERGNRFAIGAVVTIAYGGERVRRQQKEVRLSGGFLSFDNPVLYFGTGSTAIVDEISVRWPDGETTRIAGPLETAATYQISRRVLR